MTRVRKPSHPWKTEEWNSNVCYLIWRAKVTPHGRLLFQLAPLMRDTEGTEFGLLPTLTAAAEAPNLGSNKVNGPKSSGRCGAAEKAQRSVLIHSTAPGFPGFEAYPDLLRDVHGIPKRMDRIRALGNSIVPQVAEKFIQWMREAEEQGKVK